MIALIAACGRNRVIGAAGRIPWDIPEDRAHFKELTMGNVIVFGKRTYMEIGRALPGRLNIVVSGTMAAGAPDAAHTDSTPCAGEHTVFVATLEEALSYAESRVPEKKVFICGGARLYEAALPLADCLYLTEIDAAPDGDTFFPELDCAGYKKTVTGAGLSQYRYRFVTYERIPEDEPRRPRS